MQKLHIVCALVMGALWSLPAPAFAHGGQYRGPDDVVPPDARNPGRPPTPRPPGNRPPNQPDKPQTGDPRFTPPPGPSGRPQTGSDRNPTRTPRGVDPGPDLTKWQYWWEFNKDPYLNLKEAVHSLGVVSGSDLHYMGKGASLGRDTLRPSTSDILERVLPGLQRMIDGTTQRDIVSAAMVAMAKIGADHPARNIRILDVFRARLRVDDQEVRETAALAMGISQMPAAVADLTALAQDSAEGRRLTDRGEVDDRTRAFACHGLGLIAHASSDVALKRRVLDAVRDLVTGERTQSRDLRVAAIQTLRLLRPDPDGSQEEQALHRDVLDLLWSYYDREVGPGEQIIQAHVPAALAGLLGRGASPAHARAKARFRADLQPAEGRRVGANLMQSAALALGQTCTPQDARERESLLQAGRGARDAQTRYFALLALGQIGGEHARSELLQLYGRARESLEKPWLALALGVLAHHALLATGPGGEPDEEIGRALLAGLRDTANPEAAGATAVALGLARHAPAADVLLDSLAETRGKDELQGYLCIGLALLGEPRAVNPIRDIVAGAVRRPELLKQAAVALGRLGDKSVVDQLEAQLSAPDQNLAKFSAIATAYGFIGDQRTLEPLLRFLFDPSKTDLARAFAAAALGSVADKELLPWNSKIAVGLNYRAAVETLTNQVNGILDIL